MPNLRLALFLFSLFSIQILQIDSKGSKNKQQAQNDGKKVEEKIFLRSATKWKEEKLLMRARVRLLASQDDNKIYRATPIEWEGGRLGKDVAIKIVYDQKDFATLVHEVEMLKLAMQHRSEHVIKMFEAQILKGTVYMVLELGEKDLKKTFANLEKNWENLMNFGNDQKNGWVKVSKKGWNVVWMDVHKLALDMATALADFHKFEIHFALKPDNWLYVKGALKLIDLQTAVPSQKSYWDPFTWQYFCKVSDINFPNYLAATARRYASPEHTKFCDAISNGIKNVDHTNLTTASDIWSLGLLICEILQKTPQIMAKGGEWSWSVKMAHNGEMRKFAKFEIMSWAFGDPNWANSSEKAKELSEEIVKLVAKEFPHIFVLLKAIFQQVPENRPAALSIQIYLEKISKIDGKILEEQTIRELEQIWKESIRLGKKQLSKEKTQKEKIHLADYLERENEKLAILETDKAAKLIEENVIPGGGDI